MRSLEVEVRRRKKIVADQAVSIDILKDVATGDL